MAQEDFSPSARVHANAIAKLALALSAREPHDQAIDIDLNETLALLAEGKLDATQRRKLMVMLDQHPHLYRQWINLQDMLGADHQMNPNAAAAESPAAPTLWNRFKSWLEQISWAPVAGATAFGLMLGLGLNITPNSSPTPQADLASVEPALRSQAKAALEEVEFGMVGSAVPSALPLNLFLCSENPQWSAALCVSKTAGRQHWLTLDDHTGQIKALLAPLKADAIEALSFNPDGKYSAVVSKQGGQHVLTLIEWYSDAQLDEPRLAILETSKAPIEILAWNNAELSYRVAEGAAATKFIDASDQE